MTRNRSSNRLRSSLALVLLSGGLAVTMVYADAEPAVTPPPQARNSALQGQATPVPTDISLPPNDAVAAAARARKSYQSLVAERRARGAKPIGQQVEELSAATKQPLPAVQSSAYAILTLETPLPLDVYGDRLRRGLLAGVDQVTLYTELPDGYPFMVSGPPDADLLGALKAYMLRMAESSSSGAKGAAPAPAGNPSRTAAASADAVRFSETIRAALPDIDTQAVVLGFAVRVDKYLQRQGDILSQFKAAAVEVEPTPDLTPFKPVDGLFDQHAVEAFRKEHNRGR